ncbi:MAG: sigma-54 dependent transcriptional regulator [Acidobacteria bacterium]|nr:sigma-54 dependent transcriptional regulator [Acidobacteriota bacterium]
MLIRVLLTLEPASVGRRFKRLLAESDISLARAPSKVGRGRTPLPGADFDLLIASRSRLTEPTAETVRSLRELPEQPEVIVVTDSENAEERSSLLAAGCLAVVNHRVPDETLRESLRALVQRRRDQLEQGLRAERFDERPSLNDFVSRSPAIQSFMHTAHRVVRSDSSLLILGETGVGKERLAQALHSDGPRATGPFVPVNCGALPESLIESELFGHEEGAFTGASRARRGYFELAHKGTLFLDEIAETPLHLQVRLLRALETRTVQRVGGERALGVDVRVMAATNRDLEAEVAAGRFRSDLYYRLAVVTLSIPPLRERREDIPELIATYIQRFRIHLGREVETCSPEVMEALVAYDWPGNVRELINAIERAVLLCSGNRIELRDLPRSVTARADLAALEDPLAPELAAPDTWIHKPLRAVKEALIASVERRYVVEVLTATRGRIGETAKLAGLNERALYALMRRHGLKKEDFKRPVEAGRSRPARTSS